MKDYKKELEELILATIKEGASDLHITAGRYPTLRVAGNLVPLVKYSIISSEDAEGLAFEMLGGGRKQQFLEEREMDFSYSFEDKARFRVNVFFQRGFAGISLRLIPSSVKGIEELNLPVCLKDFASMKQGLFLVTGPIGQGKSTTLASMVDHINHNRAEHILTVEDPIEYFFAPDKSIIDQREVRIDTKDFHTALRSMFREDVNVAMIGEMRDLETVSTAITAAETGHLILSSLHTNSASQTIDRIIDSFPPGQQNQIRLQLSNVLGGIFSQRLLQRVSGGLIPAYELLINTPAVKNLIREKRTHEIDIVIETSSEQGMMSLNKTLANLVRQGEITAENAVAHSLSPKDLDGLIH